MASRSSVPRNFEFYLKRKDAFNVIFPSEKVLDVSPLHKLSAELVRLSGDPEDGEVWKVGISKDPGNLWVELYSLSKRGLQRIAQAAGIVFDPAHTRRTDDRSNPRRVEFQASGSIQKPDGSWYTITHSKEVDLDEIEFEEEQRLRGAILDGDVKVGPGDAEKALVYGSPEAEEEIRRRIKRTMIFWKKNKVAYADTGAHNRVIRSLLNLEPFYTQEDLDKPFVLPRVALNVDFLLKDIELRSHFIKGGLGTVLQLFGPKKTYEYRPDQFIVSLSEKEAAPADGTKPSSDTPEGGPR